MNFFQKFRDFVARPTHSRTIGILIFFILVIVISLTVYVAQQQQQIKQRASGYCADTSIQECPSDVAEVVTAGNICSSSQTSGFKCKITNSNGTYNVWGCQ